MESDRGNFLKFILSYDNSEMYKCNTDTAILSQILRGNVKKNRKYNH